MIGTATERRLIYLIILGQTSRLENNHNGIGGAFERSIEEWNASLRSCFVPADSPLS